MQREEAVERCIRDAVVAADPQGEIRADQRHGAEQIDDHLRPPERHVAPGQHVAHEGLGHERQVHQHADQPQQLARRPVGAVQQRPEHVQVDDDEEERGAGGVQVAQQPPPRHLAHDELHRVEGGRLARLVEHGEEDAGDQLQHQHQQRQRAEEVPDVEVLRRVVATELAGDEFVGGQALVEPGAESLGRGGTGSAVRGHQEATPFSSWPIVSRCSLG